MKMSLPFKLIIVLLLCASSFAGGMWYTVTGLDHASDSTLTLFKNCEYDATLVVKVTPFWKEYGIECYMEHWDESASWDEHVNLRGHRLKAEAPM